MKRHGSNPNAPAGPKPAPPPGPPSRSFRQTLFGYRETKESIRATEDYRMWMLGWWAGFEAGKDRAP